MGKLGRDAFAYYAATRSYDAVASKFGVSRRTVARCAKREDWPSRLESIEKEARERTEKKIAESIASMNDRHLRSLRAVQGRALEALRAFPISSAMDAVRALDLAIRQERVIRGEPGERSEMTGVLVAPAGILPEDWVAEQMEKNKERKCPLDADNAAP